MCVYWICDWNLKEFAKYALNLSGIALSVVWFCLCVRDHVSMPSALSLFSEGL